jgi:hypothetical protein
MAEHSDNVSGIANVKWVKYGHFVVEVSWCQHSIIVFLSSSSSSSSSRHCHDGIADAGHIVCSTAWCFAAGLRHGLVGEVQ